MEILNIVVDENRRQVWTENNMNRSDEIDNPSLDTRRERNFNTGHNINCNKTYVEQDSSFPLKKPSV